MDGPAEYRFALLEIDRLRPHEQVDERRLEELQKEIDRDGVVRQPIMVESQSMVILDGHHRVRALARLGCTVVPSYLVDYSDPGVAVYPRRPGIPVDKESVVRIGLGGTPYPPRTSRHVWARAPHPRPVALALLGKRDRG
ncbi:MAG: ParB N-terminal domain-containing protein [Firmicutes bacterium]|nr:ParB N-terminal domain-containing protein [Bacillota bacterium]